MEDQWGVILKGALQEMRNAYLPNVAVTTIFVLLAPCVGILMRTPKAIIYGAASGLTIFIWIIVYILVSQIPNLQTKWPLSPEPSQAPTDPPQLNKAQLDVMTAIAKSEDSSLTLEALYQIFTVNESRMEHCLETLQDMDVITRTEHWKGHYLYELTRLGRKVLVDKKLI